MISVAIIGILASVAIPGFRRYRLKSIRSEAMLILGQIYEAEIAFYGGNDYFSVSLYQVGVSIGQSPNNFNLQCQEGAALVCGKYYAAYVPVGSRFGFIAIAEGNPDPTVPGIDEFVIKFTN